MDKIKMELTWHNCKTCPPQEDFNSYLLVTDGWDIKEMRWCGCFRNRISVIKEQDLDKYWWADIIQTVHKTNELKENETATIRN